MSLLLIVIALVALMALAVEGRVRFPVLNRVVIAVISPVNSCIQTFTGAASSLEKKLEAITTCLLYTSDAADDLLCVDLGGRRIIKKKNKPQTGRNPQ